MNVENAVQILYDKLHLWVLEIIKMVPNIALAVLIMMLGVFVSKKIRKLTRKLFLKFAPTSTLLDLAVNFIYILCIGISVFIVLRVLHLDTAITSMLAGAGILGLALAFAFKDIASNFMSGILISFRKPFSVGDIIKVKEYMGYVQSIRLRDTTIRNFQGHFIIIPNQDIFQNPIENFTKYERRRIDINCGVSQSDDLELAKSLAIECASKVKGVISEDTTFVYNELGESTINFSLRAWIKGGDQLDYLTAQSDIIMNIKIAFAKNGISMPFPIRTIDFDMKGGKTLADMLLEFNKNRPKESE